MNLKYDLNMTCSYITCIGIRYDEYLFYLPLFSPMNVWKRSKMLEYRNYLLKTFQLTEHIRWDQRLLRFFDVLFLLRKNLSNY